jgi:hypothetical protein
MRPKIAVVTASLGGFDTKQDHEKQAVACDFVHLTDKEFPPRTAAMTPRLQARLAKMTGWQLVPDYEYYLWLDSSCKLTKSNSVEWFMEQLGDADFATFKHPHRKTVQEEADYLRHRLKINCPYVTPRYANERLDDQMAVVEPDDPLYATTAIIYKNDTPARDLLTIWWLHTSMYHTNEQLSLQTAVRHSGATINVIPDNYLKCDYIEYVRNQ